MTMSPTSDKKTNYFFANCMKCEGIIRIPITIRPDSAVSCPHCSSKFDLIAFLDQIPEANISESAPTSSAALSDSGEFDVQTTSTTETQDGKFVVPAQLAAGMRKNRRRRRKKSSSKSSSESSSSRSSSPESSASESSDSSSVESTAPRRSSATLDPNRQLSEAEELKLARRADRSQREREKIQQQREAAALREGAQARRAAAAANPRRRSSSTPKRSPVMEAFKIIIGGMLAAPIAYLLLMWGFSRDPLNLVPEISKYAPALIPPILEPQDEDGTLPSAMGAKEETDPRDLFAQPEDDSESEEDPDAEFNFGIEEDDDFDGGLDIP